jgi:alkanesulfonate monooxygenase SsuD/methylene tetrahydromethanopterin reductase-like flavin-dependent oxidoreductase (luciferase family)
MATSPQLGCCFPREFPPALVVEFAERLESGGADQLWVIEDCFYTAGISLAATALARTERLTVGIGILPAVARNPAITAMELATLARLAPGRVIAGIGHGVQEWMEQIGARPASPVTTLSEVITAVRQLLAGDTVSVHGSAVTLRDVRLDPPPDVVPPVLAGVRGPKSLAAAGRCADGIVLAELTGPDAVRQAIAQASPSGPFDVAVYTSFTIDDDRIAARHAFAPLVVELIEGGGTVGVRATPFYDDLVALAARGPDAVANAPDDWWIQLGAVGTPDDVLAHVEALAAAGATSVSFFPAPVVDVAREQVGRLLADVIAPR